MTTPQDESIEQKIELEFEAWFDNYHYAPHYNKKGLRDVYISAALPREQKIATLMTIVKNLEDKGYLSRDDKISSLESQLAAAKEVIIFYSDIEEYEESHYQLDWSLVNNPAAIQDKGKRARAFLKGEV
jgi:hypothetical protein